MEQGNHRQHSGEPRALFERARAARADQDSALDSYDATAYQRISAWLGFRKIGRDRLAFRQENASRVRWKRDVGAQVELRGARTAIPIVESAKFLMSREDRREMDEEIKGDLGRELANAISPIPYYPGRDQLFLSFINNGKMMMDVDESNIIHPLANGAEAYYQYALGDSATIRLEGGQAIELRELVVRARKPRWNLAVASLWFDAGTGHLARAAFRFSEPMDIAEMAKEEGDDPKEEVPLALRGVLFPMTFDLSALTVEYSLQRGRFWMPRTQAIEGNVRVGFLRVPFEARERFTYASVNALDSFPPMPPADGGRAARISAINHDTTLTDSMMAVKRKAVYDSLDAARAARQKQECAAKGRVTVRSTRGDGQVPVLVSVPCDTASLSRSTDLPPSIYDEGEAVFGESEMRALRDEVLTLGAQAGFGPQRPVWYFGLPMTRYNRVEGLSTGLGVEQQLGAGYKASGALRLGTADLAPNGEARIARSDGRRSLQLAGYRRLEAAHDWGAPLGFGASVNALLFGRDEGFYYRTAGAELMAVGEGRSLFEYRVFAERQNDARRETDFSLAHALNGLRMPGNIVAREGTVVGTGLHLAGSRGADPHGLRLAGDLRGEAGTGTWTWGRLGTDVTVSHGLGSSLDGALTLGAGSTTGEVPPQRLFYLGGSQTVRGQRAGSGVGDAYWLTRLELGARSVGFRPVVFGDVGWAGDRTTWRHPGRPLSGVGVGASFLDGLMRFDVAKGLWPRKSVRADFYLEARF